MNGLARACGLVVGLVLLALAPAVPAAAQDTLSALARVDAGASGLRAGRRAIALDLVLTQPVPYRVLHLDAPRRIAVEFAEVVWDDAALDALQPDGPVTGRAATAPRAGWTRLELTIDRPFTLSSAALDTDRADGGARLRLRFLPADPETFAARVASARALLPPAPEPAALPDPPPADGRLTVVLDPGHGGVDPGAERDGLREADLVLTFARELAEALTRAGGFEVVLTREADVFVSLERRIAIAHEAGGEVFVSLHADALAGGGASGATLYTLAEEASDAASAALAERHDRDEMLSGVDLTEQDDLIASVLMDLARRETDPRTDRLADAIVAGLSSAGVRLHRRPRLQAGFSVLKAADIPSVLLELGFMSSSLDLSNLQSDVWRARVADALVQALRDWQVAEAAAR